jgi:GNAT superfamily N-acetyltransferase
MAITVGPATPADAAALAEVAAATFPLACPPDAEAGDVAACIAENLSTPRFGEYLADPARLVLTARGDGRILGYTMLAVGIGDDPDIARAVTARPAVELSKMYVRAGHHGSGVATALMDAGLDWAAGTGAAAVWLGVNTANLRARSFYGKHGFTVAGTRVFLLGRSPQDDLVMVRPL